MPAPPPDERSDAGRSFTLEEAQRVRMLCGFAPDFLVHRWWSAKPGLSVKPAHVIVRGCELPLDGERGHVAFCPDHHPPGGDTLLPWDEFFATYEPTPGIPPYVPISPAPDPLFRMRNGSERADRLSVVVDSDRALGRGRLAAAVIREENALTRANS